MTKYQKVFQEMLEFNQELFNNFRELHNNYELDPGRYQEEFNSEGEKILRIVRRYENILCGKSESGKFGKFSMNLSEKFWNEVRSLFPLIDKVGLIA